MWYEQYGWQFRLVANYRSDRLDRVVLLPDGQTREGVVPIWTESTVYVDVSTSYDVTDNFTVYVQGSNITEEFENQYAQWEDYVITRNVYESRWSIGLRARFQRKAVQQGRQGACPSLQPCQLPSAALSILHPLLLNCPRRAYGTRQISY